MTSDSRTLIAAFDIFCSAALIEEDQEADMAKMELLAKQFINVVVSTNLQLEGMEVFCSAWLIKRCSGEIDRIQYDEEAGAK